MDALTRSLLPAKDTLYPGCSCDKVREWVLLVPKPLYYIYDYDTVPRQYAAVLLVRWETLLEAGLFVMDMHYILERSLSHKVTPTTKALFWAYVLASLRFFPALLLMQLISLMNVQDQEL